MISGQQVFFFPATWWAGYFFSLLNALQDIFFSPHFSAGFFFPKKVSCLHLQNVFACYIVVIAVIVLIWSYKTLHVFGMSFFRII